MPGLVRAFVAVVGLTLGAGTAAAQTGSGGAAAGTVDAAKAVAGSNADREEFNRAAGRANKRAAEAARRDVAVAATPADVTAGSILNDSKGERIGTIESVESDGAIVASGATRIKVPLVSFGKNKNGLLLGITKAEFNVLVAQATTKPQG